MMNSLFPLQKWISSTQILSKTLTNLKIMYYNSPPKIFHPNLQQESFHIHSLSSIHHLRTSQSSGTVPWEQPPIRELCHGNMTIKYIHMNISSTKSHLFIPPLPLLCRALPFLLLPKSLSSPRELLYQIHRNCTADRCIYLFQFIATESQERKSHPKNQIWSHLALGGESWGAL